MRPFIRYPGGKSRHTDKILKFFLREEMDYREPFLGGGSVFLASEFHNAWLNDLDYGIFHLWQMVKDEPQSLISLMQEHTTILEHHNEPAKIQRALDLWRAIKDDKDGILVPPGYRALFLNKTCFSGVQTGGPTGGLHQTGDYNLTSRWALATTIAKINAAHERLQGCRITNFSWQRLLDGAGNNSAIFLDPPYLVKGELCYELAFTVDDHRKLAEAVMASECRYVVTLDDCPEIRGVWLDAGYPEKRMISETWLYSMSDYRDTNKDGSELFLVDEQSFELAGRVPKTVPRNIFEDELRY